MMKKLRHCYLLPALLSIWACSCNKNVGGNQPGDDSLPSATKVEHYVFEPSLQDSQLYTVKVADEFAYVYPTYEEHICWFGVSDDGYVRVEVSLQGQKINKADVHPFAIDYQSTIENNKLILYLKQYDRVCVEFNGSIEQPLMIFANPIDENMPAKDDPQVKFFEGGKVHAAGQITLTDECRKVYIAPGAIVDGTIFAKDVDGVEIAGGGFLRTIDCARSHTDFYQRFSIALNGCKGSVVKDITNISNSGGWVSLYTNCDDSYITNVKSLGINTTEGQKTNNDSMDIIGGKNVHVSKCFLRGHDDCYCLKSQKFKLKGDVDGIYYEDCIGWNVDAGNTFEIGYETQIDIKNVHYKNIYAIHSGTSGTDMRRAAIGIHNGGAGTISNVTYENVYMDDVQEFAIFIACLKHNYNIGYDDNGQALLYSPGHIKGVSLKNVNVLSVRPSKGYCVLLGYDDSHLVSDVTFSGFRYLDRDILSLQDNVWKTKKYYSEINFE